jgi:hypothetical protein
MGEAGLNGKNVLSPSEIHPEAVDDVKKKEEIERVKTIFPKEIGKLTEEFFTSKYMYNEFVSFDPSNDPLKLIHLMEEMFKGGNYKIVGIYPNVKWSTGRRRPLLKIDQPLVVFYLTKKRLRGRLDLRISTAVDRIDYAESAKIKKRGFEMIYELNSRELVEKDVLTGVISYSLNLERYSRFSVLAHFWGVGLLKKT